MTLFLVNINFYGCHVVGHFVRSVVVCWLWFSQVWGVDCRSPPSLFLGLGDPLLFASLESWEARRALRSLAAVRKATTSSGYGPLRTSSNYFNGIKANMWLIYAAHVIMLQLLSAGYPSYCEIKSLRQWHCPLSCSRVSFHWFWTTPNRSNGLKWGSFAAQQDQSPKWISGPFHYSLDIDSSAETFQRDTFAALRTF